MLRRAVLEDLLDQRVPAAGERAEPFEIAAGVDKPVGVIDAQAIGQPLPTYGQGMDKPTARALSLPSSQTTSPTVRP